MMPSPFLHEQPFIIWHVKFYVIQILLLGMVYWEKKHGGGVPVQSRRQDLLGMKPLILDETFQIVLKEENLPFGLYSLKDSDNY